jgi:hypothetical protein
MSPCKKATGEKPAIKCPKFGSDVDLTPAEAVTLPAERHQAILMCSVYYVQLEALSLNQPSSETLSILLR